LFQYLPCTSVVTSGDRVRYRQNQRSAAFETRHEPVNSGQKCNGAREVGDNLNANEKSAQRDANTARALAVVIRCGHRPPARCRKPTDRTDYNTLRRSVMTPPYKCARPCGRATRTTSSAKSTPLVGRHRPGQMSREFTSQWVRGGWINQ